MENLIRQLYHECGDRHFELDWVKDMLSDVESQKVIPLLMNMKSVPSYGLKLVDDNRFPNGLRFVEVEREIPPKVQAFLDDFLGDRSQYRK